MNDRIKLFRITADYRKYNENKPQYYVYAENRTEARSRFKSLISWLHIYKVEEMSEEEMQAISSEADEHPEKYLIF